MRTTFLIGNGFDINLGLKTRYTEFYEYYLNIPTDNENIKNLKLHLKENQSSFWSDLEIALGKYTARLSSFEQIEEVYDDINDEMQKYILRIENMPLPQNIDIDLFKRNISSPESFLTPADRTRIRVLYNNIPIANHIIDVVNFNYTTSIDKIIGYYNKSLEIAPATYNNSYKTNINSILHVHGVIDDPILGVDNVTQISNEELVKQGEIIGYLVKPLINTTIGKLVDEKAKSSIKNANLICIYGMSLGETDAMWWKLVGERLLAGVKVIIFVKDNKANISARKMANYYRNWRNKFLDVAGIGESKRIDLEKRLIIAPNTKIFDIRTNL